MDRDIIEQEILGIVMLKFDLVDILVSKLKASDFKDPRHQNIFLLFQQMLRENKKAFNIDEVFVDHPKINSYIPIEYMCELMDVSSAVTSIDAFNSLIDSLIKLSTIDSFRNMFNHIDKFFEKDFYKGLQAVQTQVDILSSRVNKNEPVNYFDKFISSLDNPEDTTVDFGFPTLHNILGYPTYGNLVVIGGRPGMGKTTFALQCLFNYVIQEKRQAVMFSLEMTGTEIFNKLVSSISNIPYSLIREGKLTDEMKQCLKDNAKELNANKYLTLYDKSVTSIPALRACLHKAEKNGPIGLVVIDYLQLLQGEGLSRYEKITNISRDLKLLAQDFNCVVVALSQLNRKTEDGSDKRPSLSELKDSGSIEQDADSVLLLYRHNYYEKDKSISPTEEFIEVDVAKNRHKGVGSVQLSVDLTTGQFK